MSLRRENCCARNLTAKFLWRNASANLQNDLDKSRNLKIHLSWLLKLANWHFIKTCWAFLKFAKVTLTNSWNTIFLKFTFQNSGKHRFLKYSFCTFCCFSKFCFCVFAFYEIWENENWDFLKILKFKKWNLQI